LDAVSFVADGAILGAADAKWLAMRTGAASVLSIASLALLSTQQFNLEAVWCAVKVLTIGGSCTGLGTVVVFSFEKKIPSCKMKFFD
jgi:hypothetical protein